MPSAASIPDFSGIWGHLSLPGFEPPLSGPGPVVNKSRTSQVVGGDGRPVPATNGALVSSIYQFVGDYSNPILKPEAAEVVKKHGEIELSGVPAPTPSNQCWPGGMPFALWNIGMQMLQQPHQITILYSFDHEVRHVRLNQPHPAQVTPSWYGDSVGHYEGDTLGGGSACCDRPRRSAHSPCRRSSPTARSAMRSAPSCSPRSGFSASPSLVQTRTPADMLGRVIAVNAMFTGTTGSLGQFRAGVLAALLGAVPSAPIGGIGAIAVRSWTAPSRRSTTPPSDLLISDGCDWSGVIAKLFAKSMRPARKAG
jgi:hypothetical protein